MPLNASKDICQLKQWALRGLILFGVSCFTMENPVNAQIRNVPPASSPSSPLSPENRTNQPNDFAQYSPYNSGYIELDLWRLEDKRFLRSRPVFSPDRQWMAYSEVLYQPDTRQTTSKVYLTPLAELPPQGTVAPTPTFYENRLEPTTYFKTRQVILGNEYAPADPFGFCTYTVVDWSASGNRLLVKQKNGRAHSGLRASDVVVYDREKGTVIRYPEVKRAVEYYWSQQPEAIELDQSVWDVYPLGWEPGSDEVVLLKGWRFTQSGKVFLGIWRFNVVEEQSELLSLTDRVVAVAANGWVAKVDLQKYPPQKPQKPQKKPARKKQKAPSGSHLAQ